MGNPLISVLMPMFNAECYIEEAIQSIIKQTYSNWELIICDDCSTDRSYDIAKKYSIIDSRIKVIKNDKNMRQAFSRNNAFMHSNGDYIVNLDSDDRSIDDRLEKQLNFLLENPEFSFVCTNVSMFNEIDGSVRYSSSKLFPKPIDVIRNKGFVYGTIMIKREAFSAVNGYRISKTTKTSEDYDMVCRLYSRGYFGANMADVLYEYRVSEAYSRRTFNAYYNETRVALYNLKNGWLKQFHISRIVWLYAFLPIIKGLVPQKAIMKYHKYKFRREEN